MTSVPALVGDVGGTSARFARFDPAAGLGPTLELPSAGFADLGAALRTAAEHLTAAPVAAIAVAGPVGGDAIELTNVGWRFSIEATRRALGLDRLLVVNDFGALARSLPELETDAFESIRTGSHFPGAPWAVMGPGTGLGVASLVQSSNGWTPVPGEGGHRDLAASDEAEWRVIQRLAARYGHVSAERALSGPGLAALYEAVSEIDGSSWERREPAEIAARAAAGDCRASASACRLFSGWLGAVAGDLVLTVGARGGLVLAGGVIGGLGPAFDRDLFSRRFLAKGRFSTYLEPVPVSRVFDTARATLLGAALLLD